MVQLQQEFDATQIDPTQSAGQLPIGKHKVVIESSDLKENSKQTGGYLELGLKIIEGPQTGATGAYRLNIHHPNQTTVEIAHKQLSAICHAVGVFKIGDSSQLHGKPFMVDVQPQKNDPSNSEVKKVFDVNGQDVKKGGQPAQTAQTNQGQPPANTGFSQNQNPANGQSGNPQWGANPQQTANNAPANPPVQNGGQAAPWGQKAQNQAPAQNAAPQNWQQNQPPANQGGSNAEPPWGY